MLRRQLQLDLLVDVHEQILDSSRREDAVLGETLFRLVQVDVEARWTWIVFLLARMSVVPQSDGVA